jgi:RNA polymerase sigma factor (sigma-70 family)
MGSLLEELLSGYTNLRRCLARELSAEDAADNAQSSFEQALRYARQHNVLSPAGLVFGISRNLRIDAARRKRHTPHQSLEEVGEHVDQLAVCELTPERQHAGRQRLDLLIRAIDGLAPRCREAFVLCKLHGLSYEEAAQEMEISPTVVKKYLVKAMKDCRAALQ